MATYEIWYPDPRNDEPLIDEPFDETYRPGDQELEPGLHASMSYLHGMVVEVFDKMKPAVKMIGEHLAMVSKGASVDRGLLDEAVYFMDLATPKPPPRHGPPVDKFARHGKGGKRKKP